MRGASRGLRGGRRNIDDCLLTAEDTQIFRRLQIDGAYDLDLERDSLMMLMSEHQRRMGETPTARVAEVTLCYRMQR